MIEYYYFIKIQNKSNYHIYIHGEEVLVFKVSIGCVWVVNLHELVVFIPVNSRPLYFGSCEPKFANKFCYKYTNNYKFHLTFYFYKWFNYSLKPKPRGQETYASFRASF